MVDHAHSGDERLTTLADSPDLVIRQLMLSIDDLATEIGRVREKFTELRAAYKAFAMSFALAVEAHDVDTREHLSRTHRWATATARLLKLDELEEYELGFLLHDIGKWMIPREILLKPGPLDDREWVIMRTHPVAGAQMVQDVPLLKDRPSEVIRAHHERWDGKGYPYGLAGEDIPLAARIFSVCDVFDALTTDRPYRGAMTFEDALDIVRSGSATQFDERVVAAFIEVIKSVS